MSRIGKKIISIPEKVSVDVSKENVVTVKGPKGELTQEVDNSLKINIEGAECTIERSSEAKDIKAKHGLYRSLIFNMIEGVNEGYKKELELVGVGYKAVCSNNILELNLGYSHPVFLALPEEVKGAAETVKGKNPIVTLESNDKQLIGQVAAKLRSLRKIEPYKGKGVRFVGENIRRKAGKTAAK
ncbi:MAG: 50S ribosomal protein L6 [Cyclobacteriaceae bacterium]